MATKKQQAHALVSYWLGKYKARYGGPPARFNRYSLNFGFEGLLDDYGDRSRDIIDYYFKNWNSHDATWFIWHYGEVHVLLEEEEADRVEREKIRKKTIERMRNASSGQSDQGGSE